MPLMNFWNIFLLNSENNNNKILNFPSNQNQNSFIENLSKINCNENKEPLIN